MSIWLHQPTLEMIQTYSPNTMVQHLGIEFIEVGEDFIKASMPVDHRTMQPDGLLHGGASAALAESLGSMAAYLCVDVSRKMCVGLEINANHIRAVRGGKVIGTVRPLHLGNTTQVWEIHICDDQDKLVCVSRLTIAVIERK